MSDFNVGDFVICIRTKKKHLVVSDRINARGLKLADGSCTLDNGTAYWDCELQEPKIETPVPLPTDAPP